MFQNAAIDVAIGLMLMYLVLSLVCTVVNEFIATMTKLRANTLAAGLKKLIDDPSLLDTFKKHGLINGPMSTTESKPSYIDAKTFATALIDSLDPKKPIRGISQVETFLKSLPKNSNIRDILLTNLATADGNIDKLRQNLAGWYDGAMDRLSGTYQRYIKFISLAVCLVVAAIINADSLAVGKALWTDSSLRAQMVQTASATVAKGLPQAGQASTWTELAEEVRKADNTLRPLPIGWKCDTIQKCWKSLSGSQVVGLIITAFALSLGAPFWFDLLQKFIKLRGTGNKPDEKKKKPAT